MCCEANCKFSLQLNDEAVNGSLCVLISNTAQLPTFDDIHCGVVITVCIQIEYLFSSNLHLIFIASVAKA